MSPELKRLNRIWAVGNYLLSGIAIVSWLGWYIVSVLTQDDSAQVIGIAWMFFVLFLFALGNYVAGIIGSSLVHLEQVRARVDKELGER